MAAASMLAGCISMRQHRDGVTEAFLEGKAERCAKVQGVLEAANEENEGLRARLEEYRQRLRRFNQVDSNGELLPRK